MKNAAELRNIVKQIKTEVKEREKQRAKEYCENVIADMLEKTAKNGNNGKTVVLPFNVTVEEVKSYLRQNGYTATYKGNGNLKIEW